MSNADLSVIHQATTAGKVFIQTKDLADGLQPGDIKYAPYALINAAYIAGRNDLGNMDRTQFCWVWGH